MQREVLPSLNYLNLDLMSHTLVSLLQMVRKRFDVVHFHGVGNALQLPLFKVLGKNARSLLIVDGPDWNRPKWGSVARLAFRASFSLAARLANEIISDNIPVQELFLHRYGKATPLVGYGADLRKPGTLKALQKYGVEADRYVLQVAALVPDKGVHLLIEIYQGLGTEFPLIIIGDTPYMSRYKARVMSTEDPRIRFLGYVYGQEYRELLANCYLYIHPLIVDGTSPALLQAMAYENCVVASNLPEIMWSLADTGVKFRVSDANDLRERMRDLLQSPKQVAEYGQKARQQIVDHVNWVRVTDLYEFLSFRVANLTIPKRLASLTYEDLLPSDSNH